MDIPKIIFVLILIHGINSAEEKNFTESTADPFRGPELLEPSFFTLCLLSAFIIQCFITNHNLPISCAPFVMLMGFAWGIANYCMGTTNNFIKIPAFDLLYLYFPVIMFKTAFCIQDVHVFLKSLPQILIISIPISLLTALIIGMMMRLVLDPNWPILFGVLFGVLCIAIEPSDVVRMIKEMSSHTKHACILLEGEAMISLINVYMVTIVIVANVTGVVVEWSEVVLMLLSLIFWGLLVGYIFGLIGRYLIRKMSSDPLEALSLSFGVPFFTFCLVNVHLSGCGAISVMIVGLMMGMERTSFTTDLDKRLTDFWKAIAILVNVVICLDASVKTALEVIPNMQWADFILIFVTYVVANVSRFLCFVLFSPIISRIGYGVSMKNILVCIWCGLRSPISAILADISCKMMKTDHAVKDIFFVHTIWLYFLSLLINGTFTPLLVNVMGLTKISTTRQVNMNNCMKHLLTKRERAIAILKTNRFLADTNWSQFNIGTTLKHPYMTSLPTDEEDGDFLMGPRFMYCSDCKKEVIEQPTPKELQEMTREAKMRILKAKKISYIRQYENGMVSKEGIRILTQAVETAMDSEETAVELNDLCKKFSQENCFTRLIRHQAKILARKAHDFIRPPRKYWRRMCYQIVMHRRFEIFMYVVVLLNMIPIGVDVFYSLFERDQHNIAVDFTLIAVNTFFFLIFLTEFILKIMAYSWIYVCRHGFATYFKSLWNVLDFVFLCGITMELLMSYTYLLILGTTTMGILWEINLAVTILRLSRFLKLLHFFELWYPRVIKFLNSRVDSNMASTYELGKCYVTGEEEVLEMLPHMIEDVKIQEELKLKLEEDRLVITKLLGKVQKERPWIAITVKTKQVINTILNSMREAINQLRMAGWLDDFEQAKLTASLAELYKNVNAIKSVQPSAPKVIFQEVAWMAGDESTINFLFQNVTVKKFEPGDVVCAEGKVADGIYIVVTGLLMLSYHPKKSVLESLSEFGRLPIVDFISSTKYHESLRDYIVSGNCVGELSTLTTREYNCMITADTHSQVYLLTHGIIKRAMALNPDPINGLECRIWKAVSVRIAIPVLMLIPAYQSYTLDEIKYALERAFMPVLSHYKIFVVTDTMQDLILIEGVVADFNTRDLYVAPCYIPRTVQKLILPTSSLMNIPVNVGTKLLIIPEKDVDEYDVMVNAQDVCEMVSTDSARCLQHLIQNRSSNMRRRNRVKGLIKPHQHRRHRRGSGVSSRYSGTTDTSDGMSVYSTNPSSGSKSVNIDVDHSERKRSGHSPDDKKSSNK